MEPYERTLDSAQRALARRDQARDELEDVLEHDQENVPDQCTTNERVRREFRHETLSDVREGRSVGDDAPG